MSVYVPIVCALVALMFFTQAVLGYRVGVTSFAITYVIFGLISSVASVALWGMVGELLNVARAVGLVLLLWHSTLPGVVGWLLLRRWQWDWRWRKLTTGCPWGDYKSPILENPPNEY